MREGGTEERTERSHSPGRKTNSVNKRAKTECDEGYHGTERNVGTHEKRLGSQVWLGK